MKPMCQFAWVVPAQLFFLKWPETADADVIADFVHQTLTMMDESSAPQVHYISDTRRLRSLPSTGDAKELLTAFKHSKMGWTIHWSGFNPPLRIMVQVISTLHNIKVRSVGDLEEALRFLNFHDPSLPDLRDFKTTILSMANDGF